MGFPLLFQQLWRKDLCPDIQGKMSAGNTALMGLICGALPCILDKPNNSARVVRSPSSNTTLLTLTISSRTSLSPYPCPNFSCYLLTRFLACSLWCWWPSSTGLMTTPGRSPHPRWVIFQDNVHLVNVHPGKVLRLRLPPLPLLLLEQLSHQDGESMVAINICMIAAVHCENQTLHATRWTPSSTWPPPIAPPRVRSSHPTAPPSWTRWSSLTTRTKKDHFNFEALWNVPTTCLWLWYVCHKSLS